MSFVFNDKYSNAIVKGQYQKAIKLSKPKGYFRDGVRVKTGKHGIGKHYYYAIRDGIWNYYNNDGIIFRKENYKSGVLIN